MLSFSLSFCNNIYIYECVTSYITRLMNLPLHCEFQNQDEETKDTFVATCHDINLKRKSLKQKELTLEKSIAIG